MRAGCEGKQHRSVLVGQGRPRFAPVDDLLHDAPDLPIAGQECTCDHATHLRLVWQPLWLQEQGPRRGGGLAQRRGQLQAAAGSLKHREVVGRGHRVAHEADELWDEFLDLQHGGNLHEPQRGRKVRGLPAQRKTPFRGSLVYIHRKASKKRLERRGGAALRHEDLDPRRRGPMRRRATGRCAAGRRDLRIVAGSVPPLG
mmetsp:Transcript_92001/g.237380  ORF Transcript_92001/g.237380 Transcript_92001/m.237380 type:complete len:200 (+) Transcript_92001:421-1020(+)